MKEDGSEAALPLLGGLWSSLPTARSLAVFQAFCLGSGAAIAGTLAVAGVVLFFSVLFIRCAMLTSDVLQ